MAVLDQCEPARVFHYFERISRIPRGSGNEQAVSDDIRDFAHGLGLTVIQDANNNLVIRKPGTPGYETAPAVCLQGHLDMVCEKNRDSTHDFTKDPIPLYVEDGFVKAAGTTLGADNGIAVAYAMALLAADDIAHPPLLVVLTTDEEVGMNGALALAPDLLTARILINLDSEDEGVFFTSCAGGAKAALTLRGKRTPPPPGFQAQTIFVSGLKGGHSGMDIEKERANSIVVLARICDALLADGLDVRLASIRGGSKDNAIPREAEAVVFVPGESLDVFYARFQTVAEQIRREYRVTDEGLSMSAAPATGDTLCAAAVFDRETLSKMTALILLTPNGVCHMSADIPGLVETSSNLGVAVTQGDAIVLVNALRSAVDSRQAVLLRRITLLAEAFGAEIRVNNGYPAWEYDPDSAIRRLATDTYRELFGKEPVTAAVHAGLECGIFARKVSGIDMVSFGPDLLDVHTPDERMSIASVARTWALLLKVLAKVKE